MDIPTSLAGLSGQFVNSDILRTLAVHLAALAPLLPAVILVLFAAAGGRFRHAGR